MCDDRVMIFCTINYSFSVEKALWLIFLPPYRFCPKIIVCENSYNIDFYVSENLVEIL